MCGKLGSNEIESLENMMSMAVYYVIADNFDMDVDELYPDSDLINDLGMTTSIKQQLEDSIEDMFDNLHVDLGGARTVQDVVSRIAKVTVH